MRFGAAGIALSLGTFGLTVPVAHAQGRQQSAVVRGRITEAGTSRVIVGATVTVEGSTIGGRSGEDGRYQLNNVPPGPQVLTARRLGYSPTRVSLVVPPTGTLDRDIEMATNALRLQQVQVTADPRGRARGELGTATVVTRDAIANQSATSLAGVLELVPGVTLQVPGLDNVQQIPLRAVPTNTGTAERLATFGTVIIMDGVPLSNNANLQSTGPRGEIIPATSAEGGVDLRRIPAAALERVEVIRGVPSARYGDLTQGAIVIDTRAGVVKSEILTRYDPRTLEGNAVGGRSLGRAGQASLTSDLSRTLVAPGLTDASVWRSTLDAADRWTPQGFDPDNPDSGRIVLDTRANVYQVYQNEPEQPDVHPGLAFSDRSGGARLAERARIGLLSGTHFELTTSAERDWQNTTNSQLLSRGAQPFTDRLTPGRSVGHYVGGEYPASVSLQGAPWHLYSRAEEVLPFTVSSGLGLLRLGAELNREWNAGPGYQFAIEFPPQVTFNGVNGFDRPRRFDAIPAVATSAAYVDQRFVRSIGRTMSVDLQAGVRTDILHRGTWWTSSARDAVFEPRLNGQFSPVPWLRLRGGWGRTAKVPALADLYPAPQYYDVVNVNWYPPNSDERLAVITTSIKDPTNPRLGFAVATKREAGVEVDLGATGGTTSLTFFHDHTQGAVGYSPEPGFLLREHFALTDSTLGTGHPPGYVTPAQAIDTVPIFVDHPGNIENLDAQGIEWTLSAPEIPALQTRFELQGAWTISRRVHDAVDLSETERVTNFQLDSLKKRAPYWEGYAERGERSLATLRVIHHQPKAGLVITGVVQYYIREVVRPELAGDTLSWAGYVTRAGQLVPVPIAQRGDPQYADLRVVRATFLGRSQSIPSDWIASLQVSKTVFGTGRFSFYSFNALDRFGTPGTSRSEPRFFPRIRYGVELVIPIGRRRT